MASTETAKTTKKHVPGHAERLTKKAARLNQISTLQDKTFDELSKADKDALLKELAIRFGLIKDS